MHSKEPSMSAFCAHNFSQEAFIKCLRQLLLSITTFGSTLNLLLMQALNVEQKWVGAPFAALLRRHQSEYCEINDSILRVVFVLISTNSNVTQVKNSSIILQVKLCSIL